MGWDELKCAGRITWEKIINTMKLLYEDIYKSWAGLVRVITSLTRMHARMHAHSRLEGYEVVNHATA